MDRRKFITAVGTVTAMGTIGTASAQKRNGKGSEKRNGKDSRRKIVESLHEDGMEGVKNELEKQNLDYVVNSTTLEEEQSKESEITPQAGYDDGSSEVELMLAESRSNPERIWATALMELREVDYFADYYKGIDDTIGLTFDDDHWSVVGTTSAAIDHPDDVEEEGDISIYSGSIDNGGLAATADLPVDHYVRQDPRPPEWTNVILMTELRNLDGVAGNIFATYSHNGGNGWIDSVSGGAGALEVDIDYGNENFTLSEYQYFTKPLVEKSAC